MIDWKDTKWKEIDNDKLKVYKDTGDFVSGTVYFENFRNDDSNLYINYLNGIEHGQFYIEHPENDLLNIVESKGEFEYGSIISSLKGYDKEGNLIQEENKIEVTKYSVYGDEEELVDKIHFDCKEFIMYDEDGSKNHIIEYDEIGNYVITEFYDDGNIKSVEQYAYSKYRRIKERNGTSNKFYKSGKVKEEMNFQNGKANGLYSRYYENGEIEETGFFKDGFKDGKWYRYDESGELILEEEFLSPRNEIAKRSFGNENMPVIWDGNNKHGETVHYEEGRIVKIQNYDNGKLHGKTKIISSDGSVETYIYKKGLRSKSSEFLEKFKF